MAKESGLVNRAQGVTFTNRIVEHFRPQGVAFDDLFREEKS